MGSDMWVLHFKADSGFKLVIKAGCYNPACVRDNIALSSGPSWCCATNQINLGSRGTQRIPHAIGSVWTRMLCSYSGRTFTKQADRLICWTGNRVSEGPAVIDRGLSLRSCAPQGAGSASMARTAMIIWNPDHCCSFFMSPCLISSLTIIR